MPSSRVSGRRLAIGQESTAWKEIRRNGERRTSLRGHRANATPNARNARVRAQSVGSRQRSTHNGNRPTIVGNVLAKVSRARARRPDEPVPHAPLASPPRSPPQVPRRSPQGRSRAPTPVGSFDKTRSAREMRALVDECRRQPRVFLHRPGSPAASKWGVFLLRASQAKHLAARDTPALLNGGTMPARAAHGIQM